MKKVSKEEIKKANSEFKKKNKKFFGEFKEFISRGNVIDLAVGVVIGSSFSSIVNSVVNDIIMPVVGVIIGGYDFSSLAIKVGTAEVKYGSFIQATINFLIIGFFVFLFAKILNALFNKKKKEEAAAPAEPPKKSDEVLLLEEIRDALVEKNKKK